MADSVFSRRYIRKLSPIERVWVAADKLYPPSVWQAVFEGEGEFDLACWQQAASRASAANPGTRLVLQGHLGWSRWVDSEVPVKVHLLDGSNWRGASPEGAPFLNRPLPARSGPTCEILLLTGTPRRVILRVHHGVMDGMGGLRFIDDLFRELQGETSLGTRGFQTDIEMARQLGAGKLKPVKDNCQAPLPPPMNGTFIPGITWRRLTIPGKHSKSLARMALVIAQNAHELIQQSQALASRIDDNPPQPPAVRLDIPTDMRRHSPDLEPSSANLTGMITIEVSETDTLTSITRAVNAEFRAKREGMLVDALRHLRWVPTHLMTQYWQRRTRRMHKSGSYATSGSLSSIGLLPIHHYQGGGFKAKTAFGIPPGNEGLPLLIIFNSTDQQLEIVASAPKNLAGEAFEKLLFKLKAALLENPC